MRSALRLYRKPQLRFLPAAFACFVFLLLRFKKVIGHSYCVVFPCVDDLLKGAVDDAHLDGAVGAAGSSHQSGAGEGHVVHDVGDDGLGSARRCPSIGGNDSDGHEQDFVPVGVALVGFRHGGDEARDVIEGVSIGVECGQEGDFIVDEPVLLEKGVQAVSRQQ